MVSILPLSNSLLDYVGKFRRQEKFVPHQNSKSRWIKLYLWKDVIKILPDDITVTVEVG
jgi:hypothetical protein